MIDTSWSVSPASSCGPVAQLGARLNGIEEVRGSNPRRSTRFFSQLIKRTEAPPRTVGPLFVFA